MWSNHRILHRPSKFATRFAPLGLRARIPMTLVAVCLCAPEALGQGLSARFDDTVAVMGRDLQVGITVDDPTRIIRRIRIEAQVGGATTWKTTKARYEDPTWQGTFLALDLWGPDPSFANRPKTLKLRAYLYGRRGGLLIVLGEIEPLEVAVMRPAEAKAREIALSVRPEISEEAPLLLIGYVGADARAASSARARVFIGAGGAPSDLTEILGRISLGPAFAVPDRFDDGGPLVLGIEGVLRGYHRPLHSASWSLFAEGMVTTDIRFPGWDPGLGVRAGALVWVTQELALSFSAGGTAMWLSALGGDEDSELGFAGGLRVALRFGPERTTREVE